MNPRQNLFGYAKQGNGIGKRTGKPVAVVAILRDEIQFRGGGPVSIDRKRASEACVRAMTVSALACCARCAVATANMPVPPITTTWAQDLGTGLAWGLM